MLPTIIIGALALAILWPFIKLAMNSSSSRVSCPARRLMRDRRRRPHRAGCLPSHLGLPPTRGNEEGRHRAADGGEQRPRPHAPGMFLGALGPHRREPAKRKTEQAYISKGAHA